MKHLKLAHKVFVLSLLIVVAFVCTIAWIYSRVEENLYADRQREVQHAVESVWGVVDSYVQQAAAGSLTDEQAKTAAREALRHTRFDKDNYFWINDFAPSMVMHPIKPELEGQRLDETRDSSRKRFFLEIVQIARTQGGGYVQYGWPKPGHEKPVAKMSFIKAVPQWGWIVGAGIYLDDVEAELNAILYRILGVVAVVIVAVLLLAVAVGRSVSVPMRKAVAMLEGLGQGRLETRLALKRQDEIGSLSREMDAFADALQDEVLTAFERLAAGDFTFEAKGLIREPLARANVSLNTLLGEVRTVGERIASGAVQVSDASQSLSQGATEQASSLEEISASMAELSARTQENAGNVTQASELSAQVRAGAERGNQQMHAMTAAMEEIRGAGQGISRIIKTIDEIAFQTNLLALNAAVEAARAGQHGRGFAVVAEEVRSLAGRSAGAARETAEMIEETVRKVNMGAQIAVVTAEALEEIVSGICGVANLLSGIACASQEQAGGIRQIEQGLGQIDHVTQQTTSTAEECAAAAVELSGQAEGLRQMLARFRLKSSSECLSLRA